MAKRVKVVMKKDKLVDMDKATFRDVDGPADTQWRNDVFKHMLIDNGIDPDKYFKTNKPRSQGS